MSNRAAALRRLAALAWLALIASVALWPTGAEGIGLPTTALALLPLLLPAAGILKGSRRSYRWAPLALAPAITLAITEILVSSGARARAATTLAFVLTAFAVVVAALRSTPGGQSPR